MSKKHGHQGAPMSHTEARHLLNPLRRLILSPKKLIHRLDLTPDSTVLELGPGPGYFSLEIARFLTKGQLVLVDTQQEMLDMARERLEKNGVSNVGYRKGDACQLPAENGSFDLVFLVAVLGEVADRAACLKEIHRVLRPHGKLSLTEQFGDPDYIPMSENVALVQKAGFQLQEKYGVRFNYTLNFTVAEQGRRRDNR